MGLVSPTYSLAHLTACDCGRSDGRRRDNADKHTHNALLQVLVPAMRASATHVAGVNYRIRTGSREQRRQAQEGSGGECYVFVNKPAISPLRCPACPTPFPAGQSASPAQQGIPESWGRPPFPTEGGFPAIADKGGARRHTFLQLDKPPHRADMTRQVQQGHTQIKLTHLMTTDVAYRQAVHYYIDNTAALRIGKMYCQSQYAPRSNPTTAL